MQSDSTPLVLAVDPGSEKCGVALVSEAGGVAYRSIVPTTGLIESIRTLVLQYRPVHLVCGAGTGSKAILRALGAAGIETPITPVDESYTSEAARRRYVEENPPRGLYRLLPRSLRTPSAPYDDYVAVILAERFWREAGAVKRDSRPPDS